MGCKVLYYPGSDKSNRYLDLTVKSLLSIEDVEVTRAYNRKVYFTSPLKNFQYKKYDVVIVNWLENQLRNRKGGFSLPGFFAFIYTFLYFRMLGKKLIYVRHNHYPHGMKGHSASLVAWIATQAAEFSDVKVCHSGHMAEADYRYVPHPLYDFSEPAHEENNSSEGYYVIFGRIERYKNIKSVIEAWDSHSKLLIAGASSDDVYLAELMEKSRGRNIEFSAGYIDEKEAQQLVNCSRGMIVANSDDNMIVSSSFFFAISCGVPVFAISTPFFEWLKKSRNFTGLKTFSSVEEMISTLDISRGVAPSRTEIKHQANLLFGDTVLQQCWIDALARC